MTTGDDHRMGALLDGHLLDVRTVAHEKNDPAVPVLRHARFEGIAAHGTHHEQLLAGLRAQCAGDERATEGGDDVRQRGRNDPRARERR